MSVIEEPLVFVDIETNGMSHRRGRVIEVAAIRAESDLAADQAFNSTVDPGTEIPHFITKLTGITEKDVAGAPTFADIADELYNILQDGIFIAHNVRFDYAFLKQEFRRVGKSFNPRMLCTVKLSQSLYPQYRSHKLESVIDRCNIKVNNRHRAYDDAYALWQFMQHVHKNFAKDTLTAAVKLQLRKPSLPKGLSVSLVESLPDDPGVYIFQDDKGSPLYIGKSVNIKKRVLSHFSKDHEVESEFKISQAVSHIEVMPAGGELEALLLESKLIKELQPLYNRRLRRNQKLTLARQKLDENGYINISIDDTELIDPSNTEDILSVYTTKGRARQYLDQAIKDHLLCPKLLGLEKGKGSCFLYQLRKCGGACVGKETPEKYNARVLEYFAEKRIENWPFSSPVLIEEKNPVILPTLKSIVVDKWCVIADITQEEECSPVIKLYDRAFDIDTYKILRSHFRSKMHQLSIKPISPSKLRAMAN